MILAQLFLVDMYCQITNLIPALLPWYGFLGARTWYVAFNLEYYLQNPAEIIAIWNGGLAIHGAIVAGGLYLYFVSKRLGLTFFNLTDIAVVPILLGQAIGRWGNFMNQEAHGPETTKEFLGGTLHLPQFIVEGMNIEGVYYHSTCPIWFRRLKVALIWENAPSDDLNIVICSLS